MSGKTAPGWKLLASTEIFMALLFIAWFLSKGVLYSKATSWKPLNNVLQTPLSNAFRKKEKAAHEEEDGDLYWIPYQKAGPIEKVFAMAFASRVGMGTYNEIIADDKSMDTEAIIHQWGPFFAKFVPKHRFFYAANLVKQFAESFILNGLSGHGLGVAQSACMFALSVLVACMYIFESPYVLIAQSRSETIASVGRVFVFFFSLLGATGAMNKEAAANAMTVILLVLLLQSTITALWPILSDLYKTARLRCQKLLQAETTENDDPVVKHLESSQSSRASADKLESQSTDVFEPVQKLNAENAKKLPDIDA